MIRPFVLRDLPTLHRFRNRGLFLDTATALTWGPTMVPVGALLTHLAPATGIFTYLGVSDRDSGRTVVSQLVHHASSACARFSFLAPEAALESATFLQLVDHMAAQAGERRAHNLVAEVDEGTLTYDVLRRASFAIYARQRIWALDHKLDYERGPGSWRLVLSKDDFDIRVLYNAVVPPLTQQVEAPPWERLRGLVFRQEGELLAYVDLNHGPMGIMVQPFFHPDMEQIPIRLSALLSRIPNRRARPIYIRVRSYQGWLEAALDELGAQPGARQAVMVKRMAVTVKKPVLATLPAIKGTTANPTLPFN